MKIHFYQTNSENNRLEKVLENELVITGNFKGDVDVLKPMLTVKNATVPQYNYCYIPSINRYYFVDKIEITQGNLFTVSLSIDVLMTYKDAIRELNVVVSSSQSNPYYNGYVDSYDVRTDYETKQFENNFNENGEIVLIALYGADRE